MSRTLCVTLLLTTAFGSVLADEIRPPEEKFEGEVVLQSETLKVIEGRTEVIVPRASVVCSEAFLFRYNNGDLLAATPTNRGKGGYRRSTDGGRTWHEIPETLVREGGAAYQFPAPDSDVISWPGSNVAPRVLRKPADPDGLWEYEVDFYRFASGGPTENREKAVIHMPEAAILVPDHAIVRLDDGSLLAVCSTHLVRRGRNVSPVGHVTKWWLSYEFDKPHHLTKLRVFNGGDISAGLGIGDVEIYTTRDGARWNRVFEGRFRENPPGDDFPGVTYDIEDSQTRQVVLEIHSNLGFRIGNIVQLGEIHFHETGPDTKRSNYLRWPTEVVSVTASSAVSAKLLAENTVNGHGLQGERHTTAESGMWQAHCAKNQTVVVRSTDRGRSWTYLATVADGDESLYPEGFCEPDLLVMPDGKVLCILRTGGTICLNESADGGKTWTPPREIPGFRGVWPNLVCTEDGVVVAFAGRPDDWLTFSLDEGATWTTPIRVGGSNPQRGCDCTHYNGIVEVAPDRLLAVYCRSVDPDDVENGGPCTVDLVGTYFRVERKD